MQSTQMSENSYNLSEYLYISNVYRTHRTVSWAKTNTIIIKYVHTGVQIIALEQSAAGVTKNVLFDKERSLGVIKIQNKDEEYYLISLYFILFMMEELNKKI